MIRTGLADLRDSWQTWLAVSVVFITVTATIGLAGLIEASSATIPVAQRQSISTIGGINITFCIILALSVINAATGLVVNARRGAIARLLLGGASPTQVTGFITIQLIVVTLVCSVVGCLLALPFFEPALDIILKDRPEQRPTLFEPVATLVKMALWCVVISVVGGFFQARAATKVSPVEALRASQGAGPSRRRVWVHIGRIVGVLACAGMVVGSVAWVVSNVDELHKRGLSAVAMSMQISFFGVFLIGTALALVAPYFLPLLTKLLALIPLPTASWRIATSSVIARGDRSARTVVPLIFAIGLIFSLMALMDNIVAAFKIQRPGAVITGNTIEALLTLIGLPLVISVAGAVGNILMMARQRDAELCMNGVCGATPRQQILIPLLEALIVTIVASVFALGMCYAAVSIFAMGSASELKIEPSIPWTLLASSAGLSYVVIAAAMTLPALPALQKPPARVVAALVAQ